MLKNYFKIALRNMRKYKGYSFINIVGLATGMACCLIIMLFVQEELSYDGFHQNASRLYRMNVNFVSADGVFSNSLSGAPMATHLLKDVPEIEQAVRFHQPMSEDIMLGYGNRRFYEKRFFYADAEVFQAFTFPFLQGEPLTALRDPFRVVLTESMAKKYFGEENPLGKTIRLEEQQDYQITGVMQDVPANAHLHFDFLGSFSTLESTLGQQLLQDWMFNPFMTYVLLAENTTRAQVEEKFPQFMDAYTAQILGADLKLRPWLQPITEIHLYPQGNEIEMGSNMSYVYIFSAIAAMVLLIACFNFMNLSTARATTRAKEIALLTVSAQAIKAALANPVEALRYE